MRLLPDNTVKIENISQSPFHGWVRCTIPTANVPSFRVNQPHAIGRSIGNHTVVDIKTSVMSMGDANFTYPQPSQVQPVSPVLPKDIYTVIGGMVTVGGNAMRLVRAQTDGAAFLAEFCARVGSFVYTLWLVYYPDQPAWCRGELLIVHSDQSHPRTKATIGALHVRAGDAIVVPLGRAPVDYPVDPGTVVADGQGVAMPLLCVWLRHLRPADWGSVAAELAGAVTAVGSLQIHGDHEPVVANREQLMTNARAWWGEAQRRLHTWDRPVCGPSPRSSDTGEQEDQLFHPGAEAAVPGGLIPRYLSAIKLHANRPCNHYEPDGSPLDIARHPNLRFWDGRPHFRTSHDRLGKDSELTAEEAHGFWGPDVQHFLFSSLVAMAKITGSPLCQHLWRQMTTTYLLQRTARRGEGQAAIDSGRELGYEGLFIVACKEGLEDRVRAAEVVARFRERCEQILLPQLVGKDWLYEFLDDPHLGVGRWVITWQEALGAYGLDLAGEALGIPEIREVALRVAKNVLWLAWRMGANGWECSEQMPVEGGMTWGQGYNHFGMPLAIKTVLRHEPNNTKAKLIWAQLAAATDNDKLRWIPPR